MITDAMTTNLDILFENNYLNNQYFYLKLYKHKHNNHF